MTTTASTSALLLVGVNHTTAPLEVRERLAIPAVRLADATRSLVHQPGVREAMILSTCNRVEFIVQHEALTDAEREALAPGVTSMLPRFLQEYFALPVAAFEPHLYHFREGEAVRHLFRVASSLDSMVVGESQILGQVKQSWNVAREVGAVKSGLDPLLQRAFSVAKRVRTETQIGSSSVSVASVAAEMARKIFGSLRDKTILLVGAGKMSDLAARHLVSHGATTLLVSNRTQQRAETMATELRSPGVTTGVVPFGQLEHNLPLADIVITSTGAGTGPDTPHIITPALARATLQRRRNRPVFFIDIAVPRDVSPEVNSVEGCFVYDIDDLQQIAASHVTVRSREAEAAETIVAGEVARYNARLADQPHVDAIKHLQTSAEAARQQELQRTAQRLAADPLSPAQLAAIDAMTKSLMAKLLHPQLAAIRKRATPADESSEE